VEEEEEEESMGSSFVFPSKSVLGDPSDELCSNECKG
jgi:hypothetical protein